jgi:nucleotide-binding universal stress UspA family protein
MLERHTVVAAYDATEEAADGLALARLLGQLTDTEVLIVRVLQGMVDASEANRTTQAMVRDEVAGTRRALVAAVPDDSGSAPIVPVLDADLARGLHDAAKTNDADFLVLGSSHHSSIGRIFLGSSAETVVNQAPCPVAVAPPGFRDAPGLTPDVIGCAYDGRPESLEALHAAVDLARAGGMALRVIAVGDHVDALLDDAEERAAELAQGTVAVGRLALAGDPGKALVAESGAGVGILVMGSRGLGMVRRAVLGSVSTKVLRNARCPVLITPRRD